MNQDTIVNLLTQNRDSIKEILKSKFDYVYEETHKCYLHNLPSCLKISNNMIQNKAYIITNLISSSIRLNTIKGSTVMIRDYEFDKLYNIHLSGGYNIKFEIMYYKKDDTYISHEELTNNYINTLNFDIILVYDPKFKLFNKVILKSSYWRDGNYDYKNVLIAKSVPIICNLEATDTFDLRYDLEDELIDKIGFINQFNNLICCDTIDTLA